MRKSLLLTCLVLTGPMLSLTAIGADATASKKDWPGWRGPNHDAIATEKGLLNEWSEDGPPLLWSADGLGGGFSSIAIAGGRIYTLGRLPAGTCLICLDLSGKEVWATPIGKDDPNCTPTVDGDRVYAMDRHGELACCDTATGKVIWTRSFAKEFGGSDPTWGYSESPRVDGDSLIVTPGSQEALLVALNKKSGQVIWKTSNAKLGDRGHGGAGYASVQISHGAGVKQYVQMIGKGLVSVNAKDGSFLWTYNKVANGTATIPTPIVRGDYVFGASGYGDGGACLVKLVKDGSGVNAEEVWYKKSNELQNHHGGVILLGDHLYLGHGSNQGFPVCVDFLTGKDLWRPGRGPGEGSAAIVCADGHLYFRYENGEMALIEATPKEYHLKGTFKIKTKHSASWPHPRWCSTVGCTFAINKTCIATTSRRADSRSEFGCEMSTV